MSGRVKIILFAAILALAIIVSAVFIRAAYVLPIIMYHSVGPSVEKTDRLTVSVDTFERQMKFLKDHGYSVLSLKDAAVLISHKAKFPPRPIVITFDDGYKDNYEYAFPVLKKYDIPATIFVIIDRVGAPGMLDWDRIKNMKRSGIIDFGVHTFDHGLLKEPLSEDALLRQTRDAKTFLESRLDGSVDAFSYPLGVFSENSRQAVIDSGYTVAVVTNPGKAVPNDDVFALKRLRISENAKNMFIFWIETSGYYNFIRENRHK